MLFYLYLFIFFVHMSLAGYSFFFFLNNRAPPELSPLPLHAALPISGATHLQVFTRIILPLAAPGIATASIFAFLGAWNEFTLGLVLIQQNELKTVPVGLALFLDRKSTRLNSSHSQISYAVFCLKKKK